MDSMRTFQLHLIPGLMQTKEYACAVIECGFFQGFSPDVDGLAEIRMRRQLVLDSKIRPIFGPWGVRLHFGSSLADEK